MVWMFIFSASVGSTEAQGSDSGEEYKIAKGDVLEINVWKEKELTRTVIVRNDGKISMPLVDDVQAAGKNPIHLKNQIKDKLAEYIESPVVTVIVAAQKGQQFFVIGEVVNIGAYPLGQDLTVVQALALTGGFTEWADRDDIVILRREDGHEKRINIDYEDIVSGQTPQQNILLQANDTLIVN